MMQKEITLSRESLLEVINALPLAISVIDKNRTVALVNKSTSRFVNKEESTLVGLLGGEALGCINHETSELGCGFGQECLKCRLRQAILDTLEKRETCEMVETTMVFKHRGECHLRISTQPLILNHEVTALLVIEDITKSKTHEAVLIEKERLAAAVKTAGAVCHEVNQPLMIILGLAELLLEGLDESASGVSDLMEIKRQAERLGQVTKKLLTLSDFHTRPYLHREILDLDKSSAP